MSSNDILDMYIYETNSLLEQLEISFWTRKRGIPSLRTT